MHPKLCMVMVITFKIMDVCGQALGDICETNIVNWNAKTVQFNAATKVSVSRSVDIALVANDLFGDPHR